jgi:hypothetical protein
MEDVEGTRGVVWQKLLCKAFFRAVLERCRSIQLQPQAPELQLTSLQAKETLASAPCCRRMRSHSSEEDDELHLWTSKKGEAPLN